MSPAAYSGNLGLVRIVGAWVARSVERRRLRRLDGALLKDLGLAAGDVEREAAKPFWRA